MKTTNTIVVIAILTIAFSSVNDAAQAAPRKPTCVGPANEAVFAEYGIVPLRSGAYFDAGGDIHEFTNWRIFRYDDDATSLIERTTFSAQVLELTLDMASTDYLAPGFKYVWQVQHEAPTSGLSEWSDECTFKVGDPISETLETIAAGETVGDFEMISIPHFPNNPDPQTVFGISYHPDNHRIGTWNPENDRYVEIGQGLNMEPGRSYWVLSRDDLVVSFDGIPVNMSYEVEVCLHTHPSTKTGWNMIAPPNAANYLWNEVMVGRFTDDVDPIIVDPVPVTSPVASTLINHRIYEWKKGDYADHKLDENFVLNTYRGYWVKAIVDGAYLVFPVSAQVGGVSTPRNTMLAWKGKAVRWMKRLLPSPREAMADNDSPPVPMESFDGSTNPLFEGCFVQTILK